jgi:hypothetical protein
MDSKLIEGYRTTIDKIRVNEKFNNIYFVWRTAWLQMLVWVEVGLRWMWFICYLEIKKRRTIIRH